MMQHVVTCKQPVRKLVTKSADELKERVKEIKALQVMSKQDTMEMRLKHVG